MISIKPALTAPRRLPASLVLIPVLTLTACGGDETADESAPADDDVAAQADDSAAQDTSDNGEDTSDTGETGDSFCDQLVEFFDADMNGEIGPAELAAEYEGLAEIAPGELSEPLEILAEGSAAMAESGDPADMPDAGAFDAANQDLSTYVFEECDIRDLG